jgi:hypothetical protein
MKFVRSKFGSPPKEFKHLFGPCIRQSTLENFFVIRKVEKNESQSIPVSKKLRDQRKSNEEDDPSQLRITDYYAN